MSIQHPLVADYMASHLFTLSPDADIHDAVNFLLENRISGAPVVHGGHLVGMLSEKDCLRLLTLGAEHAEAAGRVSDFMTTEVTTIRPDRNSSDGLLQVSSCSSPSEEFLWSTVACCWDKSVVVTCCGPLRKDSKTVVRPT